MVGLSIQLVDEKVDQGNVGLAILSACYTLLLLPLSMSS